MQVSKWGEVVSAYEPLRVCGVGVDEGVGVGLRRISGSRKRNLAGCFFLFGRTTSLERGMQGNCECGVPVSSDVIRCHQKVRPMLIDGCSTEAAIVLMIPIPSEL